MHHLTQRKRIWRVLFILTVLLLTGCGGNRASEPVLPDDGPAPTTSRSAALAFVRKALTAGQSAVEGGVFTLTITDSEVTSFLNIRRDLMGELGGVGIDNLGQIEGLEGLGEDGINIDAWRDLLQQRDEGSPLRPRLREARVNFKANGDVVARGEFALLRWRFPARFVVAPEASEGEMVLDFVEGQIGRVNLPEPVFDLLGKGVARALLAGQEYAEITQISVGAGTLTISGRRNQ